MLMMEDFLHEYWPHFLILLSIVIGTPAAIHAAMTKPDVRSAIGWVGVIFLSPILGALIYYIVGINRIRIVTIGQKRQNAQGNEHLVATQFGVQGADIADKFGMRFLSMKTLGDRISVHTLATDNSITILSKGDEAYGQMLLAIDGAQRSIILESYIFDSDRIGKRFVEHLLKAKNRGVEIRVLIDAIGARYSSPSIIKLLDAAGIRNDVFNGRVITGLRLPYANMRTHRKVMIVDGQYAFSGGMNIRESFTEEFAGDNYSHDTHFKITGPIVSELFSICAGDWAFTTNEVLEGPAWAIELPSKGVSDGVIARVVASGPDSNLGNNLDMMMGAFSVARKSILIRSPYFLPDREFISALTTAARRGVDVDIIVPNSNNLTLVDRAMTAQFDQLLKNYCRIWRSKGPFNHSKMMVVDNVWSYVGSSNLDARSLRLNFEVDVEVLDEKFAETLTKEMRESLEDSYGVDLNQLRSKPFFVRLLNKILWLASPYL